jgi:hypothetical protein
MIVNCAFDRSSDRLDSFMMDERHIWGIAVSKILRDAEVARDEFVVLLYIHHPGIKP